MELTDEMIHDAGICSRRCDSCSMRIDGASSCADMCVGWLAAALKDERAKPKVWDGAPDDAPMAKVFFYYNDDKGAHAMETYTRELPKSRAREIAEEAWADCHSDCNRKEEDIQRITAAILKREAEIKEETNGLNI